MPGQQNPVKRSKTFTGCWTCRDRGVKCDLEKPACNRCTRTKRLCSGYGIRLVWVDENDAPPKQAQRRMFSERQRDNPVFSDAHITAALEDLDTLEIPDDVLIPPFSVFQSRCIRNNEGSVQQPARSDLSLQDYDEDVDLIHDLGESSLQPYSTPPLPINEQDTSFDLKTRILPMLPQFLASASTDERRLFHYWVTHLSSSFLAMAAVDNPFRNILIPLALQSALEPAGFSGHAALLHTIYATAATHWAQRDPTQTRLGILAVKHHGAGLPLLGQSLREESKGQRKAILASVILMSTIDVISGTCNSWRTHVKGGKEWLKLQESAWKKSAEASVLCQVFECIDLLGHSQGSLADLARGSYSNLEEYTFLQSPSEIQTSLTEGSEYCLDRFYGLPRAAFEAISATNDLRLLSLAPDHDQLEHVKMLITFAKPDTSYCEFSSGTEQARFFHYAWVYHYACLVYFEREFSVDGAPDLQLEVQQAVQHIKAIAGLEKASELCGLLWPTFILACEAAEHDVRCSFVELFEDLAPTAVGGYQTSAKVVKEIWKHRENPIVSLKAHRQRILQDPAYDLFLI